MFLLEDPLVKDFKLWERALFRLGAGWQGQGRMRGFKRPGHKIWHWQIDAETETLYHLKSKEKMDIQAPSLIPRYSDRRNCWSQSHWDVPLVEQGDYCTTNEVAPTMMAIILHTPAAKQAHPHNNIWDVLQILGMLLDLGEPKDSWQWCLDQGYDWRRFVCRSYRWIIHQTSSSGIMHQCIYYGVFKRPWTHGGVLCGSK